jgi:FixJ family two-component response regulator
VFPWQYAEAIDQLGVLITGRDEPAIRAIASKGGVFAFLIKPFDYEALLDAVKRSRSVAADGFQ